MQNDSNITIFVMSIKSGKSMKSSEFIREIKRKGWQFIRQGKGSHEIYGKNGIEVVVPNHGSKELGKGLEKKLRKQMGI